MTYTQTKPYPYGFYTLNDENRPAFEALLDQCFGPDRKQKSVAYLREGVEPVAGLSMVAVEFKTGLVIGGIECTPVVLGHTRTPAVMVGNVVVAEPWRKNSGNQPLEAIGFHLGQDLMRFVIHTATQQGHGALVLKSKSPELMDYYAKYGFSHAPVSKLQLPDYHGNCPHKQAADSALLMGLELKPHGLREVFGPIIKDWNAPAMVKVAAPRSTRTLTCA